MPALKRNKPSIVCHTHVERVDADSRHTILPEGGNYLGVQPADRTVRDRDPFGFTCGDTFVKVIPFGFRVSAGTGTMDDDDPFRPCRRNCRGNGGKALTVDCAVGALISKYAPAEF
jgi:hypothetical protein